MANELADARHSLAQEGERSKAASDTLQAIADATRGARIAIEADKSEHKRLVQEAGQWQTELVTLRTTLEQLERDRERLHARQAQANEQLTTMDFEISGLARADAESQSRLVEMRRTLADRSRISETARGESDALLAQLAELRRSPWLEQSHRDTRRFGTEP